MVTNNLRLFSKMQKYGIPKFWSQWHFNIYDVSIQLQKGLFNRSLPACRGAVSVVKI